MDSRVTVLIPNFNGERFLPFLFESLILQTLKGYCCIFLDDGSSDNSVEIARSYKQQLPNLEILELPNAGIAGNWNRGMEMVTTEFFTLLHCDDGYEPEYLAEMVKLMDRYPKAALGHCGALTMDERGESIYSSIEAYKQGRFLPSVAFSRSIEDEYAQLLLGDYIICPSVIYRVSMVKMVGLFNEKLTQTLDWEYWFRVLLCGLPICGTNLRLYRYRRHENNLSVQNAVDMSRYLEELKTLEWAHESGTKKRLVNSVLATGIIANILIYDIGLALVNRDYAAAKLKYDFLIQKELASRPLNYGLLWLIYLGRHGGWLLIRSIALLVTGLSYHAKFRALFGRKG
ncbi:MAG: glycosyltransferase involved in cell wall biosynthesis [Candidatus Azotimanducaceae bacterium]|jgi:glycosyltransferase involved in cell wall biosynthesis